MLNMRWVGDLVSKMETARLTRTLGLVCHDERSLSRAARAFTGLLQAARGPGRAAR